MDGERNPGESDPNSKAEVDHESLNEELLRATVEEVEEPLLGSVGSMVPNVAAHVRLLLVEVVLSIPSSVLHLWYSKTLAIDKSHVLHVA